MPRPAVGQPLGGWVHGDQCQAPGLAEPQELLGRRAWDVPSTLVPGLEFGGTEVLLGVMELCLQMELLAWPSGSGKGLG